MAYMLGDSIRGRGIGQQAGGHGKQAKDETFGDRLGNVEAKALFESSCDIQ